jgi:hypothetical protein
VEVYRSETRSVVKSFLRHNLSFCNCISELDGALASLIRRMEATQYHEELPMIRDLMLANNETVMKEMARRGTQP